MISTVRRCLRVGGPGTLIARAANLEFLIKLIPDQVRPLLACGAVHLWLCDADALTLTSTAGHDPTIGVVQRLIVTVADEEIGAGHLPFVRTIADRRPEHTALIPEGGIDFDQVIEQREVAMLTAALRQAGGGKIAAGRLLKLNPQCVKYLCRKHDL